jgi:hypothetical protein
MVGGYNRWEDAMVAQAGLLDFYQTLRGQKMLRAMGRTMNGQHPPEQRRPDDFLVRLQLGVLSIADPIYVSSDVAETVDYARESFVPEPVRANDAFTPHGFALLPKPLLLPDAEWNETQFTAVRAISWTTLVSEDDPDVGCFWISYYSHAEDDLLIGRVGESNTSETFDMDVHKIMRGIAGGLSLLHTFQWSFGDTPWVSETGESYGCRECHHLLENLHHPECSMSGHVTDAQSETYASTDVQKRGVAQVALMQTFWRIAAQVYRGKERAPRGIWKDANRKGMETKDVTLIRLRRARDPREHEPTGREVTVQFIVRGHWRKQPYKDGIRQIWIAPYIKGPEDAPFKDTKRVWEFVR